MFADEPTGNLDSHTSAEILALLRDMVTTYGQTTVMVTHDATAASMADRLLFLADGQDRARSGPGRAGRRPGRDSGGQRPVMQVALRGLWGRKLRTALTALSIILGTSMITGTFILRDQINNAFSSIFHESNQGIDVVLLQEDRLHLGQRSDRRPAAPSR